MNATKTKVITKIHVVEQSALEAAAATELEETKPYRLKTSTVVWFCITVLSLVIIYAL